MLNIKNLTTIPTHVYGHTLDVVITRDMDEVVSNAVYIYIVTDPGLSDSSGKISNDHVAIMFNVLAAEPPPTQKT